MKAGSWRIATLLAGSLVVAGLLAMGVAAQPKQNGAATRSTGKPPASKQSAPPNKQNAAAKEAGAPAKEESPQGEAKLSPAQTALRDQLRRVLASYLANQTFNTREDTPSEILLWCLAFGAEAQVAYEGSSGTKVNAIGALCWNTPCAGYSLLQIGDGRLMARVGYGFQESPSQFLAVLAQARVPADYEIRVGQQRRTVADLVESEKLSCVAGSDHSMKLVALSHYLPADAVWKSVSGESWSLEQILQQELDRKVSQTDVEATNRLLGLSYALDRRAHRDRPIEGQYARAEKYVRDSQEFALRIAHADGSWHPRFFAFQGASSDAAGTLRSTGHILEWLVFSLADDRLEEPTLTKSVGYVAATLENWQRSVNAASLSPRLVGALMHATHALALYDQRVFRPFDAQKP